MMCVWCDRPGAKAPLLIRGNRQRQRQIRGSFAALRMTAEKTSKGKSKGNRNRDGDCRSLHSASQRQGRDAAVEMTGFGREEQR